MHDIRISVEPIHVGTITFTTGQHKIIHRVPTPVIPPIQCPYSWIFRNDGAQFPTVVTAPSGVFEKFHGFFCSNRFTSKHFVSIRLSVVRNFAFETAELWYFKGKSTERIFGQADIVSFCSSTQCRVEHLALWHVATKFVFQHFINFPDGVWFRKG